MKKLDIFYFDNELGEFDNFNPRFVMEQKFCKEILTLIAKKSPYYYSTTMISKKLKVSKSEINNAIERLTNINAIKKNNESYALSFPYFSKLDIKVIRKLIKPEILNLEQMLFNEFNELSILMSNTYPNINNKEALYHLICGKIFDGMFFDYLENKKLLKQTFVQKDNRDFLIIGYENSHYCHKFNSRLFCSFNHARFGKSSFSSFGNAAGERLDLFRYFKLRDINSLYGKFKKLHKLLSDYSPQDIVKKCLGIIAHPQYNNSNSPFFESLLLTSYIDKKGEVKVPIFENSELVLDKLYNHICLNIGMQICKSLERIKWKISKSDITSINHKIDIDQICNEIWHIYFGLLNKFLIDKKIVARPQQFYHQGAYLKCVYLSRDNSSK